MAQENEHIRKLIAARDREVEQHRNVADALAQAYERGETERMREVFISLQNTIEAIERAIQHEKMLAGRSILKERTGKVRRARRARCKIESARMSLLPNLPRLWELELNVS